MTNNERQTLIMFARENAEEMLAEAQRIEKDGKENYPESGYVLPITINMKDGSKSIGAFTNITFGFGLTCDIIIFKNSSNQIVLKDREKKHFLMIVDFDKDLDEYDYDNALIKEKTLE